jgi:hypothetical protein
MMKKVVTLRGTCQKAYQLLQGEACGLSEKQLCRRIDVSRQVIDRRLKRLAGLGLVSKQGVYGAIWRCNPFKSTHSNVTTSGRVELHDLGFVVRPLGLPKWWGGRANRLLCLGFGDIRGVRWGRYEYSEARVGGWAVQFHAEAIQFMSGSRFLGANGWDCFEEGVRSFLRCLGDVEARLGFVLFPGGVPVVSVRSQHLNHVRDALAERCVREGERFEVRVGGERRLWVDMSDPLGVEAGSARFGVTDMGRYQRFVEDVLVSDPFLPSTLSKKSVEHEVSLFRHEGDIGLIKGVLGLSGGVAGIPGEGEEGADCRVRPDYFG